jgi:hypothetical protein
MELGVREVQFFAANVVACSPSGFGEEAPFIRCGFLFFRLFSRNISLTRSLFFTIILVEVFLLYSLFSTFQQFKTNQKKNYTWIESATVLLGLKRSRKRRN